jgi:hypothetical protein
MKCKYWDCGWCYAPEGVKNNAVQGGCFEPECCETYLMQKKPIMTEQEHLECEIKELQLEIKSGEQTLAVIQRILEQKQRKLKEMNHCTPPKYNVDYIDDKMAIVNGVQYQRVEEPKIKTLYDVLYEEGGMYSSVCNTVVEIVKGWLPNTRFEDGSVYNIGWNDCLQKIEENLK